MGYSIWLECKYCKQEPPTELSTTYNYAPYFYEHINKDLGIRFLYGKTGAEIIPIIEKAIEPHKDKKPIEDGWAYTEGNAVSYLKELLEACKKYPDLILGGD